MNENFMISHPKEKNEKIRRRGGRVGGRKEKTKRKRRG